MYRKNCEIFVSLVCLLACIVSGSVLAAESRIEVSLDLGSVQQGIGASVLSEALEDQGLDVVLVDQSKESGDEAIRVVMIGETVDPSIEEEGFRLSRSSTGFELSVIDHSGAMYGMMELAELIRIHGWEDVPQRLVNPRFPFRAIKFNLPWSSYRRHSSLQQHYDTVRDLKFWEGYLDMMAENRFNSLTLWAIHPFPYMIRPKNFPLACSFDDAELEEWQSFWHSLFKMAKDRGIDTYLVNWNIFGSEGFLEHYDSGANWDEGTHYTDSNNSSTIERYTKECVTQLINEYPNLTGLGTSLGEGMNDMSAQEREEWVLRTFVAGMNEADRKIKFIHRVPFTAVAHSGGSTDRKTEEMTRVAIESLDVIKPVWVEIKFNWSHGHSTPKLVQVHGGSISDAYWNPLPENYSITWMVRNEDFYILRWGEPDFIRKHIELNGQSYVGGYFVGSECYIPAKEYIHEPGHDHIDWTYSWERQWLYYKQWGRLLYDPGTPDRVFELDFDRRYGEGIGSKMVKAYALASKMPLRFGAYLFSTWDFTMYSEGMMLPKQNGGQFYDDRDSPFVSLEELMRAKVLDPEYLSVSDYVQAIQDGSVEAGRVTPLELADELQNSGDQAIAIVNTIQTEGKTLECEIMDVLAWSYQCRYFADKLRAAVALETYRVTGVESEKEASIHWLMLARKEWANLVSVTKQHHQPISLIQAKGEDFTWDIFSDEVEYDIKFAQIFEYKEE